MSKKINRLETYIDNYAYSIDDENGVQIFVRNVDEFENIYYTRLLHFPSPNDRTYRANEDQYKALKAIVVRFIDLQHHAQLMKELKS